MLKVHSNLVFTAQVEQEGQGVDVCSPAQKYGQLHATQSRTQRGGEKNNTAGGKQPNGKYLWVEVHFKNPKLNVGLICPFMCAFNFHFGFR